MLRVGNHQEKTGSIRQYMQSLFFFNFLLCVGALPINNAAMVSDEETQHMDTHTPSPPDPHPSRRPPSLEQSSRCYTGGLLVIQFKYSRVYIQIS